MIALTITPSLITFQNPNFIQLNPKKPNQLSLISPISIQNPNFPTIRSSATVGEATSTDKEEEKEVEVKYGDFPAIKTAKRVVLVRHGQSTWNAEGRIQGSSDFSVLTEKGEAQAETCRQMLIDDSFDVCFSSPLARSKRTGEVIWSNRKEPVITDYDLREIDLYSFQGLLKQEGKEKYGTAYRQWQVDPPNLVIDGHYPVRELWARAKNCWDKILAHEGKSVLVVAHNAVNQALIGTAIGLGYEYFRFLLQSNCGVSVLDFTPSEDGGPPYICLNRLNQTPNSPISSGSSGGRKSSQRIVLVCHGSVDNNEEANLPNMVDQPMNMLGFIQSQKTAELLLDLKVHTVVTSPRKASSETADIISKVQEAADCLGADCVPRYVDVKKITEMDVDAMLGLSKDLDALETEALTALWDQSGKAWQRLLQELTDPSEPQKIVVAVENPVLHVAFMAHCLNLTSDWLKSFHLDEGSISVIDFPDGPSGRGVIRCINYTAHLGRWSIPITKSTEDEEEFY